MYTYKEAYDKIIQAYFKDEIKPMDSEFCFCGTLSPDYNWNTSESEVSLGNYPYTYEQYKKMETALFSTGNPCFNVMSFPFSTHQEYEQVLFEGMCAALEVLKQIHIERGENIEGQFEFKKRELVTA